MTPTVNAFASKLLRIRQHLDELVAEEIDEDPEIDDAVLEGIAYLRGALALSGVGTPLDDPLEKLGTQDDLDEDLEPSDDDGPGSGF